VSCETFGRELQDYGRGRSRRMRHALRTATVTRPISATWSYGLQMTTELVWSDELVHADPGNDRTQQT